MKAMTRLLTTGLLSSLIALCWFVQPAVSPAMDGPTLAQKVYERDDGRDAYAKMCMVLIDKRGKERTRFLLTATKDFGTLSKIYTRFTSPAAINGTGFLTWENEDRDDDQFLYLPALRRVRRIVSKQKDSRFVNSDYTYEDMQKRKPAKDHHQILGSQVIDGHECWLLESVPKDPDDSQYGKRVSWIVKDIYVVIKVEYYDKKNRLNKVFSAQRLDKIDGIWTIMESEMDDHERRHRTLMKTLAVQYNKGLPDGVFTRRYLANAK
jgi:hypothetical protein